MKNILTLLFSLLLPLSMLGQICDGNLGENIFTEGDFGSGTANVLLPNPQIAPGYIYQASPPPDDGYYTITNNTTSWGSFAATYWSNIGDNSPDPNGYMMVVNASFAPGLFYKQEVTGLCENTLYVFSADVFNLADGIKPNLSFLLNGQVLYSSGDVPKNEKWVTYGFTFETAPGHTSLTLALQNNAPGGFGNDIALDNINFQACGPKALILPTDIADICEDGSPIELEATILGSQYPTPHLQWQQSFDGGLTWSDIPSANGLTYTHTNLSGGFYHYRYLLANDPSNLLNTKCRVVSNVKVVHVVPKFYTIVDTLCEGLSFVLDNNAYSASGIYVDSLLTSIGCDSIVTLHLTIVPDEGLKAVFSLLAPTCPYVEDGSIVVEAVVNGVEPFSFSINGGPAVAQGDVFGLGSGPYSYSITDRYGCHLDTTVVVPSPAVFLVDLGDDLFVQLGDEVRLSPVLLGTAASFSWQPLDLVGCGDCWSLDLRPAISAMYYLTAISPNGCTSTDSIYVGVEKIRKVFIPNAFSPNSDGINDHFTVYGAMPNVQSVASLMVFDRWGSMVFERRNFLPNDVASGWDGMVRGKQAASGIYTYFTKVLFLDGAIVLFEGGVVLLK